MGKRDAEIRIGDVEREAACTALGAHLTAGRVTLSEFDDRMTSIASAVTRRDLEKLFTDLPAPHPDLSGAKQVTTRLSNAPARPTRRPD